MPVYANRAASTNPFHHCQQQYSTITLRMSNQSSSPPLLSNSINDVNANMAPKTSIANSMANSMQPIGSPQQLQQSLSARKLTRSDSTFGEDIFDESLNELSQLNQRHVLRQQWYRKNNIVSRLRRSTSTASNSSSSSSSSSGISSGVYSNCSANTSSFASSFSSSFATLSSLSESCDTNECINPPTTESDYPRILRRSSFKNKFATCPYKPYYKPRRLSLQILKGHLELPENFKFYPAKALLVDLNSQTSASINSRFLINTDKENGSLYGSMATGSTKSNPASPNKSNLNYVQGGEGCISMADGDELSSSMQAAQIVITSSTAGSGSSQPAGSNGQQALVRSKSLDDLNTLLYYSNLYPSPTPSDTATGSNLMPGPMAGQQSASHYSSFNRIFSDYSKLDFDPSSGASPQLFFNSSGPASHPPTQQSLFPPDLTLGASNIKGISYSSHEICNAGSNQQPAQSMNSTNNTSLCDIENVMKKISSLRV